MTELGKTNLSDRGDPSSNHEIDLRELFKVLTSGLRIISLFILISGLFSVFYALYQDNYYKSETILRLSNEQNVASSSLSQFSGIASLAGVSLPSSIDNQAALAIEKIRSRDFLKHLLTFKGVLPSLMAPDYYDISSQKLFFDKTIYDSDNDTWIRKANPPYQSKPSHIEAHEKYIQMISRNDAIIVFRMEPTCFFKLQFACPELSQSVQ